MKIVILTGVMVCGTACFPHQLTGTGKTAKKEPTVIDVDKKIAIELCRSKQAKPAPKSAKVNLEIKTLEKETDELDSFFGEEGPDDEDLGEGQDE